MLRYEGRQGPAEVYVETAEQAEAYARRHHPEGFRAISGHAFDDDDLGIGAWPATDDKPPPHAVFASMLERFQAVAYRNPTLVAAVARALRERLAAFELGV